MEQVQSLINRLSRQLTANAHAAEMLVTTELLRQELVKAMELPSEKTVAGVSVWMPNGFYTARMNGSSTTNPSTPTGHQNGYAPVNEQVISNPIVQNIAIPKEDIAIPAVPKQVYAAPTPPIATREAPEKPAEIPENFNLEVEPTEEEMVGLGYRDLEKQRQEAKVDTTPEINYAYIKVQELAAAKHAKMGEPTMKPLPKYTEVEAFMTKTFPVAPPPVAKKEVNELVIDPSIPLNTKLKEHKVELGEVLATGPKVPDLRKAFAINDRYQLINSLFRGDEDMFDRSLRTLNNFDNYQEASYWAKRELETKLGWSQEDELVKGFHKLLSRRF